MTVPLMHVVRHDPLQIESFMDKAEDSFEEVCCRLDHFMGDKPVHFPEVEVEAAYDSCAIGIHFRVRGRYIRAVARHHQDEVYRDSCVEFFFTPGADPGAGYFNLEMNCGGTMLFHFQPEPRKNRVILSPKECSAIPVSHTLPDRVDPEITDFLIWEVAYAIPFDLLEIYCPIVRPGPGTVWRGNFYKCADNTSHPHWLTWAPVDSVVPNFHLPASFGMLKFED